MASAGTHPAPAIATGAVDVAARRGLPLSSAAPRGIEQVRDADDWIITVCDAAHEEFDGDVAAHWSVPDPVRVGTETAFDEAYDELAERIRALLPQLTPRP